MKKEYKNILIVRTDRIGDVVLTTPTFTCFKKMWPQAKISVLLSPLTVDLVDGNPSVDQILIDDKDHLNGGLKGFLELKDTLKKNDFDLAVIFHTKKRSNLLCYLAGIPERIGYKNKKFGFLLTCPIEDLRHEGNKHESQYCLDVLKELGARGDECQPEVFIPIHEHHNKWVEGFLQQNKIDKRQKIILIHPGASDPSKMWPVDRFAELISQIKESKDSQVIIVGSSELKLIAEEIMSKALDSSIIDLTGQISVGQLVSLVNRSHMMISNDSGPVHLAAAFNTPVVSIFTRNQPGINPERWGPLSKNSKVVSVPSNLKSLNINNGNMDFKKAKAQDVKYMELIQTHEVLEAVDALFNMC